ncbi:tetratricopeptide repeat protein [Bacteroidales bacterium OttesenSCG-928-K22]|nr:tetratricopeptide repeat protein [Bacteroidales bacterium OttesenSCG-928-L14]MDL2240292.1 tetratricopeptide repeat protein [Bacteroidales bacterium OttesenSCG-928-K22]
MKIIKKICLTLMLLVTTSLNIIAQTPEERFSAAVNEYNAENFTSAVTLFQELYNEGYENFELFYDLGNSYFRVNDIPSAILYYERALRLMPNNEDVKYNISIANKLIVDKIEAVPEMFYVKWWDSLVNLLPMKTWTMLSLILFGGTILFIVLMILLNNITLKKTSFRLSIFVLILFVISLCVNVSLKKQITNENYAIVFTPTVTAKGSPIDNGVDIFVVHKGTKVNINDRVGEWIEIVLANGQTGWIRAVDVKVI